MSEFGSRMSLSNSGLGRSNSSFPSSRHIPLTHTDTIEPLLPFMDQEEEYDYKGALLFVVGLLSLYGVAILLLIVSLIRKSRSALEVKDHLRDFEAMRRASQKRSLRMSRENSEKMAATGANYGGKMAATSGAYYAGRALRKTKSDVERGTSERTTSERVTLFGRTKSLDCHTPSECPLLERVTSSELVTSSERVTSLDRVTSSDAVTSPDPVTSSDRCSVCTVNEEETNSKTNSKTCYYSSLRRAPLVSPVISALRATDEPGTVAL